MFSEADVYWHVLFTTPHLSSNGNTTESVINVLGHPNQSCSIHLHSKWITRRKKNTSFRPKPWSCPFSTTSQKTPESLQQNTQPNYMVFPTFISHILPTAPLLIKKDKNLSQRSRKTKMWKTEMIVIFPNLQIDVRGMRTMRMIPVFQPYYPLIQTVWIKHFICDLSQVGDLIHRANNVLYCWPWPIWRTNSIPSATA